MMPYSGKLAAFHIARFAGGPEYHPARLTALK
jgi:hypothetical protein